MAVGTALALVTALKSASDIADKIRKSNDIEEVRNGASALCDMLFNARAQALQIQEEKAQVDEELRAAKREAERLVDFSDQSEKYERVKMRNSFVYREKSPPGGNAGAPYICPKCFGDKKISFLNPGYGYTGTDGHCFSCNANVSLTP